VRNKAWSTFAYRAVALDERCRNVWPTSASEAPARSISVAAQ
jgi:hypothetical protein